MNRSPGLAGVLSVILPGLGHLYAGATARGLGLAAAFVALIQAEQVVVAGVLAVWLFGIVNAIRTTEEIVRAHAEGRPPAVALDRNWAIGLIVAGVLATFGRISELEWVLRLWPLALVWVGVQLYRGQPVIPGSAGAPTQGSGVAPAEQPGEAPAPPPDTSAPPAPPADANPSPAPPDNEEN